MSHIYFNSYDINELLDEEQRLNDEVENVVDQVIGELNELRQVAKDLILFGENYIRPFPGSLTKLDKIITRAQTVIKKYRG